MRNILRLKLTSGWGGNDAMPAKAPVAVLALKGFARTPHRGIQFFQFCQAQRLVGLFFFCQQFPQTLYVLP